MYVHPPGTVGFVWTGGDEHRLGKQLEAAGSPGKVGWGAVGVRSYGRQARTPFFPQGKTFALFLLSFLTAIKGSQTRRRRGPGLEWREKTKKGCKLPQTTDGTQYPQKRRGREGGRWAHQPWGPRLRYDRVGAEMNLSQEFRQPLPGPPGSLAPSARLPLSPGASSRAAHHQLFPGVELKIGFLTGSSTGPHEAWPPAART